MTQQPSMTQQHSITQQYTAQPSEPQRWWVTYSPFAWVMIGFIKLWRALISPLYGEVCKYHPSCSAYGLRAVRRHGALLGSGLIIGRLVRCNPWSAGGYDPVPGTAEAAQWKMEQARPRSDESVATVAGPAGDLATPVLAAAVLATRAHSPAHPYDSRGHTAPTPTTTEVNL